MWAKDNYQEHMLGYLDWVQTEIERLEQARIRQHDLDELYDDLKIAQERLWRLIGAADVDWERFRSPLEVSCDTLLRTFYQVPYTGSLIPSVHFIMAEKLEHTYSVWKQAEMLS